MPNTTPAQKVAARCAGFIFEVQIRMNISYVPVNRKVHLSGSFSLCWEWFIAFVNDKAFVNDHCAPSCYIIFSVAPWTFIYLGYKDGEMQLSLFSIKKYRVEMVTVGFIMLPWKVAPSRFVSLFKGDTELLEDERIS